MRPRVRLWAWGVVVVGLLLLWLGCRKGAEEPEVEAWISDLTAAPDSIPADAASQSTITAEISTEGVDKDSHTIHFSTDKGTISPDTVLTDSLGVAVTYLTAAADSGTALVTAALTVSLADTEMADTATVEVVFTPLAGFNFASISAEPDSIFADGVSTSQITAVLKEDGDPAPGEVVDFSTNLGTVSPQVDTTDNLGIVTTVLTAGTTPGNAQVAATHSEAGSVTATVVLLPPEQLYFQSITTNPDSIWADGSSTSQITATLYRGGNPVSGEVVSFSTSPNLGQWISPQADTTDTWGRAVTVLTAGTVPGYAQVAATHAEAGSVADTVTLLSPPVGPVYIESIEAAPEIIMADGISTSDITAVFMYETGGPAEGLAINFTTTAGSVTPSDTTDALGVATAVLTSGTATDTATVTAAYGVDVKDSVWVWMVSPEDTVPASILVRSVSDSVIYVQGSGYNETSTIVFQVRDRNGHPLIWPVLVDFRIESGPNGGEYLYPTSATTGDSALVSTTLNSGDLSGVVSIVAEVGAIESVPIPINILSGPPHPDHFTLAIETLNQYAYYIAGVENTFTAYLADLHNNPVPDGIAVWFTSDCGMMVPGYGHTFEGRCSNTLVSCAPWPDWPDSTGFFWVYARTIDGNGNLIEEKARALWSWYTVIDLTPTSFAVPDGGAQLFQYSVSDMFGNPLTAGTHITVTADVGDLRGDTDVTLPDTQCPEGWTQFEVTLYDDDPGNPGDPELCSVKVTVTSDNGDRSESADGTVD